MDFAKNVFQVHGIDADGVVVLRQRLTRARLPKLFGKLPPCLVGIEACATSPYWARELIALGHEEADAGAVCEAVRKTRQERRG